MSNYPTQYSIPFDKSLTLQGIGVARSVDYCTCAKADIIEYPCDKGIYHPSGLLIC